MDYHGRREVERKLAIQDRMAQNRGKRIPGALMDEDMDDYSDDQGLNQQMMKERMKLRMQDQRMADDDDSNI